MPRRRPMMLAAAVCPEFKSEEPHAKPRQLHADIPAVAQRTDTRAPIFEYLFTFSGIRPNSQRSADMVQNHRRIRESLGKIDKFENLRVIQKGLET